MDAFLIYIYIAAGLALLLFIQRYLGQVIKFIFNPRLFYLFFRHIVLPYIFQRQRLWGPITRLQALLHSIHFGGTLACNIIGVSGLAAAQSRSGSLAVLHFIPMALVPKFSLAAKLIGISLSTYRRLHSALGYMAFLQGILHVILALQAIRFDLNDRLQKYGFVAAVALGILMLAALPWIRQWAYEISIKTHSLLGLVAIIMTWIHLKHRYSFNGICLIASIGVYILAACINFTRQIFRNFITNKPLAIAEVTKTTDAIELEIKPARPWKVVAGQYVYLRVPGARFLSFAESHPFNITWWENGPDGKALSISVLAKVESGFTKDLFGNPNSRYKVLLDGPYGEQKDLGSFDSVVLIATGIGITALLPYAKELIEGRLGQSSRVSLIWELDEEYHEDWISNWMDQLLEEDKKTLRLSYSLYMLNKSTIAQDGEKLNIGRRGATFYGKADLQGILKKEAQICPGKVLIATSAHPKIRDEVRNIYLSLPERFGYFETEFQPNEGVDGFWTPKREGHHIGVV